MSNYKGYLLNIDGLTLPFIDGTNIIENGSYKFEKKNNVAYEWTDSWGNHHIEDFHNPKVVITFTIKDRSAEQQAKLKELFKIDKTLNVEYFDDYTQEYATSKFYVEEIGSMQAIATSDNIMYKSMEMKLREY